MRFCSKGWPSAASTRSPASRIRPAIRSWRVVSPVALAFVAYGCGQLLGGGGLFAVFIAGVMLANGRYTMRRFEPQLLVRVMHPLNHAAEITVLLMLGLLVSPSL